MKYYNKLLKLEICAVSFSGNVFVSMQKNQSEILKMKYGFDSANLLVKKALKSLNVIENISKH